MDSSATCRSREFAKTRNQPRSRGELPAAGSRACRRSILKAINDQTTKPWHGTAGLESRRPIPSLPMSSPACGSRIPIALYFPDAQITKRDLAVVLHRRRFLHPAPRRGPAAFAVRRPDDAHVSRASSRNTWAKPCPGRYAGSPSRNRARRHRHLHRRRRSRGVDLAGADGRPGNSPLGLPRR